MASAASTMSSGSAASSPKGCPRLSNTITTHCCPSVSSRTAAASCRVTTGRLAAAVLHGAPAAQVLDLRGAHPLDAGDLLNRHRADFAGCVLEEQQGVAFAVDASPPAP